MRLLIRKAVCLALLVFSLCFGSTSAQRYDGPRYQAAESFRLPIALMERMLRDLNRIGGGRDLSEDEIGAIGRMSTSLTEFSSMGRPNVTDFEERASNYPFSLQDAVIGSHQISGFADRAAELEGFRNPDRLLAWFDQYLGVMEEGARQQTLDDLWRRYFLLYEQENARARFERDVTYVVIIVVLLAIVRFDVTKKIIKESYDFAFWMLKKAHEKFVAFVDRAKKKRRRRKRFNAKLRKQAGQTEGI